MEPLTREETAAIIKEIVDELEFYRPDIWYSPDMRDVAENE